MILQIRKRLYTDRGAPENRRLKSLTSLVTVWRSSLFGDASSSAVKQVRRTVTYKTIRSVVDQQKLKNTIHTDCRHTGQVIPLIQFDWNFQNVRIHFPKLKTTFSFLINNLTNHKIYVHNLFPRLIQMNHLDKWDMYHVEVDQHVLEEFH